MSGEPCPAPSAPPRPPPRPWPVSLPAYWPSSLRVYKDFLAYSCHFFSRCWSVHNVYSCWAKLSSAHIVSCCFIVVKWSLMRDFVANWKRFVDKLSENKINSKLSNLKWLSTVVDVIDSHREAWRVKASSVATSRWNVCRTYIVTEHDL